MHVSAPKLSGGSETQPSNLRHDAFISYRTSRSPDREVAEELQRVLERFPVPRSLRDRVVRPSSSRWRGSRLHICRDVSDLSANPDLWEALRLELESSRWLIVVCSPETADSPWVQREIEAFERARGDENVLAVLVEGEPEVSIPQALREDSREVVRAGGTPTEVEPLATDLRAPNVKSAITRLAGWRTPREQQKRFDILAPILGLRSRDELVRRHWAQTKQRIAVALSGLVIVGLVLGFFAYRAEVQRRHAIEQRSARLIADSFETVERNPSKAMILAWRAREANPSERSQEAISAAYRVLTYRLTNRRESLPLTGLTGLHLSGVFKEGGQLNVVSRNGRHRLFVTERGKTGPDPPGDVYLSDDETLRVIPLGSKDSQTYRRRVEFVGFDRGQTHAFVTRHYNLAVFELDGSLVGGFGFSRFTKSPVHHVSGYFAGGYVLAGDGTGGLWLVQPRDDPRDRSRGHEIRGERAGDPILDSQLSPSGTHACLVYTSGAAELLQIAGEGAEPAVASLLEEGVLFASFADNREDLIVLSGQKGLLQAWRVAGEEAALDRAFEGLSGDLDWAFLSDTGPELLTVSRDHVVTILDFETREVLTRFDFSRDVDWLAMRRMPRHWQPPGSARRAQAGGREWLLTSEGVFLHEGERYLRMTDSFRQAESVTEAGGSVWLQLKGLTVRVEGHSVEPPPGDVGQVKAITDLNGSAYLATTNGVWRFADGDYERVRGIEGKAHSLHLTTEGLWALTGGEAYRVSGIDASPLSGPEEPVLGLHARQDEVWFLTGTAMGTVPLSHGPAYLLREGASRPLPAPDSEIREVHFVGEDTWLLDGRHSGPAYRWDGFTAEAIPDLETKVTGLVSVEDQSGQTVWLLGEGGALRVRGKEVREYLTGDNQVFDVTRVQGQTWLLTWSSPHVPGAAYRVEGSVTKAFRDGTLAVQAIRENDDGVVVAVVWEGGQLTEVPVGS